LGTGVFDMHRFFFGGFFRFIGFRPGFDSVEFDVASTSDNVFVDV